jgi:hypothetical protein
MKSCGTLHKRNSVHWERTLGDAKFVYRHDNAPHAAWTYVTTFPKHFHDGTEDNVVASYISSEPQQALREFCRYIRSVLRTQFSAS